LYTVQTPVRWQCAGYLLKRIFVAAATLICQLLVFAAVAAALTAIIIRHHIMSNDNPTRWEHWALKELGFGLQMQSICQRMVSWVSLLYRTTDEVIHVTGLCSW
jgi:ABC-type iron transport system FetAB permease component